MRPLVRAGHAATGYGTVGVRSGKPFLEVRSGKIDFGRIDYRPRA